jgi:hypothetical protein
LTDDLTDSLLRGSDTRLNVPEHKHLVFIVSDWVTVNSKGTTMQIVLSFVHDNAAIVQVSEHQVD